jgi:subtilisin family serine protease
LAQGEGIVIAIIDDAFDIDHPEFAGTGKIIGAKTLTALTPVKALGRKTLLSATVLQPPVLHAPMVKPAPAAWPLEPVSCR